MTINALIVHLLVPSTIVIRPPPANQEKCPHCPTSTFIIVDMAKRANTMELPEPPEPKNIKLQVYVVLVDV